MKVGILTFHRANNHGAVLQCYALQTYLASIGLDVEVIDYLQPAIERTYNTFSLRLLREKILHPMDVIRYIKNTPIRRINNCKFNIFRKRSLHLSPVFTGKGLLDYDIVFHGSDQIWNPKLTGGRLDDIYLGFYRQKEHGKKIAYAVSFEDKHISEDEAAIYKAGIKNFNAISLREPSLGKILSPLTDKKINFVVDPTLLLLRTDYDKIAEDVDEKKKYVLVYTVGPASLALKIAYRIASERNLKVINITNKNITPNMFVGYFKHASFVVSVSFHGTIFSLLYNKSFYTVATGKTSDIRYYDLLKKFQLSSRCVTCMPDEITDIDYTSFDVDLEECVHESKNFIRQNL